jgi:hypothetical protein
MQDSRNGGNVAVLSVGNWDDALLSVELRQRCAAYCCLELEELRARGGET